MPMTDLIGRLLCRLGQHHWHKSRAESIAYGIIFTFICRRKGCEAEHVEAAW